MKQFHLPKEPGIYISKIYMCVCVSVSDSPLSFLYLTYLFESTFRPQDPDGVYVFPRDERLFALLPTRPLIIFPARCPHVFLFFSFFMYLLSISCLKVKPISVARGNSDAIYGPEQYRFSIHYSWICYTRICLKGLEL